MNAFAETDNGQSYFLSSFPGPFPEPDPDPAPDPDPVPIPGPGIPGVDPGFHIEPEPVPASLTQGICFNIRGI